MTFKNGNIPWNKGKKGIKFSKEHKKKLSEAFKGRVAWNKGKKGVLKATSGSFKKGEKTGKDNCNWKGGKYATTVGYIYVLKKDHPFATKAGYIRQHRLIMEKHLGRYLKPEEIVHHKNEIVNDNRLENLELLASISEHAKFHYSKQKPEALQ